MPLKKIRKHFRKTQKKVQMGIKKSQRRVEKRIKRVGKKISRAVYSTESPEIIARSFSIGVFLSFLPFFGLQLVLIIPLMFLMRINKMAIILGAFFVNAITIWVLYPLAYHTGQFILDEPETAFVWEKLSFPYLFSLGKPLLVGTLVLGLIFAVVLYFVTFFLVVHYRKKMDGN